MGSGSIESTPLRKCPTLFGVFKVEIESFVITKQKTGVLSSNLEHNTCLSCTLTKQKQKTRVAEGYNHVISYNQTMVFFINSQYQFYGRSFIVELINKDKVQGFGMIAIDEFIKQKKKDYSVKVFINNDKEKLGFANIKCSFEEIKAEPITLMFETALIRRRTRPAMKCKVRVEVGEEVLETSLSDDKDENLPNWFGQPLTFNVLKQYLSGATITLLDESAEVGSLTLNLSQIQRSKDPQISLREQIYYQETFLAGSLRFYIKKGAQDTTFAKEQVIQSKYVTVKKKELNEQEQAQQMNQFKKKAEQEALDFKKKQEQKKQPQGVQQQGKQGQKVQEERKPLLNEPKQVLQVQVALNEPKQVLQVQVVPKN